MSGPIKLEYRAQPSALVFMAKTLRRAPGFAADGGLPDIRARWRRQRVSKRRLADFSVLSGLPAGTHHSILYPHAISFPVQLAVLTNPAFPVPIWNVLQVRNHLVQHVPLPRDTVLDLTVRTGARRVLAKGVEMDLHVGVHAEGQLVWEAVNTFYARGCFGAAEAVATRSPSVTGAEMERWRAPAHGRWRYGCLTGDFNGLHLTDWYARRFGFARAFLHPQRAIGECLGHLGVARTAPLRLDAWIKGPVFYGAEVSLCAEADADARKFALHVDGDARPAIVGCLSAPNTTQGNPA